MPFPQKGALGYKAEDALGFFFESIHQGALGYEGVFFFFFRSLYAFPPKGALGYEAAPFLHL